MHLFACLTERYGAQGNDASDVLFTKPWFRCPPYLVGMVAAMLWCMYKAHLTAYVDHAIRASVLSAGIRNPRERLQR